MCNVTQIRPRRRSASPSGFTLIELLLVLVILGILAAIVVPNIAGQSEKAKVAAAKTEIKAIDDALDMYNVDNGHYPSNEDGLRALRASGNSQHRDYLKKDVVNDPWDHPYIYRFPGSINTNGCDVLSMGPDGLEGTPDDIGNFSNTSGH